MPRPRGFARRLNPIEQYYSVVLNHLPKISFGNSSCEVNGTHCFCPFHRQISLVNGTLEKVFLYSRLGCSERKFVLYFQHFIFNNVKKKNFFFHLSRTLICCDC